MSASQSVLDSLKYGYDIVVATTQLSINSQMKTFMSELDGRQVPPPVVTCVFLGDSHVPLHQVDYDELLAASKGSDPFSVPNGADPHTDQDLLNLAAAHFAYGFRLQVGMPPIDPESVPDIVRLRADGSTVDFTLLSAQFEAVWFDPGEGTTPGLNWRHRNQSEDDAPWTFVCEGVVKCETVPVADYATLPAQIQAQLANIDGAFSIQQLMFDLSTAPMVSYPDVDDGWQGPATSMMINFAFPTYISQLQALTGNPTLGFTIVQQATDPSAVEFPITAMNMGWTPVVGPDGTPVKDPTDEQAQLTTLNYLCATDGHRLPAPAPFTWNWVDESEADEYSGAIAIRRLTLAEKIRDQMMPSVVANCYQPYVRVSIEWTGAADVTMNVKPGGTPDYQTTIAAYGSDLQVLTFSYHGHDQDAGNPSIYGTASLDTYYTVSVRFGGNKITVEQKQKFDAMVKESGSTTTGSPVDIHRIDVCTLGVDDHGQLIAEMSTPTPATNSASQSTQGWWGELLGAPDSGNLYSSTAAVLAGTAGTLLNSLPFTVFQYLVFPGGESFTYQSVAFSPYGDLVSYLIYADPDSIPYTPPLPGQVAGADRINDGQWLANDGYLVSENQQYAAYLQDDSNFVLCHTDRHGVPDLSRPYWSVYANDTKRIVGKGAAPCYASMQSDGNFVLYNGKNPFSPGAPYWAINGALPTLDSFTAVMQNDGNFVVYRRKPWTEDLLDVIYQTNTAYISKQGQ